MSRLLRFSAALGMATFAAACLPPNDLPEPKATGTQPGTQGTSGVNQGPNVTMPFCNPFTDFIPSLDANLGSLNLRTIVNELTATAQGTWRAAPPSAQPFAVTLAPSFDGEPGSIRVSYTDGQVRLIRREYVGCTPGAECADIAVRCVDSIEIDMDIQASSQSGALAESWKGTVTIDDPRDPDLAGKDPDPRIATHGHSISVKVNPFAIQGNAKVESVKLAPNSKLTKHALQFSVRSKASKVTSASLSSFLEVNIKLPNHPESAGAAGAGGMSHYRFEPLSGK